MPLPLVAIAARKAALQKARGLKRGIKKGVRVQKMKRTRAVARTRRRAAGLAERKDTRPYILSPEGIAMMSVAILIDIIPPIFVLLLDILLGLGELVSWPIDIFATILLGGWMWVRGGEMTFGKKLMKYLKRRAPLMLAEYIPIVGAFPFWTLNVFLFLRK